jgi:hypothetical protein
MNNIPHSTESLSCSEWFPNAKLAAAMALELVLANCKLPREAIPMAGLKKNGHLGSAKAIIQ